MTLVKMDGIQTLTGKRPPLGATGSATCRICGRALSDPKSVKRGIGPVCWANQKNTDRQSVNALKTWAKCGVFVERDDIEYLDIGTLYRKLLDKKPSCICGRSLENGDIKHYEHEGGLYLMGYSEKQWIYVNCNHCNYDMAIWKIKRELGGYF